MAKPVHRINLSMPEDLYQKLASSAENLGVRPTAMINFIVNAYVTGEDTINALANLKAVSDKAISVKTFPDMYEVSDNG